MIQFWTTNIRETETMQWGMGKETDEQAHMNTIKRRKTGDQQAYGPVQNVHWKVWSLRFDLIKNIYA